jgi:hypothetical protein
VTVMSTSVDPTTKLPVVPVRIVLPCFVVFDITVLCTKYVAVDSKYSCSCMACICVLLIWQRLQFSYTYLTV